MKPSLPDFPQSSSSVDAVLLMAHGGPESLDEVEPFLRRVMQSRAPAANEIAAILERYRLIGGKSPLLERTRQQASALSAELHKQGLSLPVYVGMRHWHPSIQETVEQMHRDGIRSIVAISLTPYYSSMSVGAYIQTFNTARAAFPDMTAIAVEHWHMQPFLLEAFAQRVREALNADPAAMRASAQLLFTAHSLPAHILEEGDPYPTALEETVSGIMQRLAKGETPVPAWRLAYQSRGLRGQAWLRPDVEKILRETPEGQYILIVPIGFVCDHVEILYDIDIFYQEVARERKILLRRTESLNADPRFIQALAAVVCAHLPVHQVCE